MSLDTPDLRIDSTVTLSNGVKMPMLGLGTSHNGGCDVGAAVEAAVALNVRHIDTAQRYGTEAAVGEALARTGVPRSEVFVTTKVWPARYGDLEASLRESCAALRAPSVDLALLHWPGCDGGAAGRLEAWRGLERALDAGLARAIGVSNFLPEHLGPLCAAARVKPMVNQCEFNPMQQNRDVAAWCRKNGVVFSGYCPLAKTQALSHPAVARVAERLGRTPAQVLIRWSLEKGVPTIPKSTRPDRVRENCGVFGWALAAGDTRELDALHQNLRVTWDPTGVP